MKKIKIGLKFDHPQNGPSTVTGRYLNQAKQTFMVQGIDAKGYIFEMTERFLKSVLDDGCDDSDLEDLLLEERVTRLETVARQHHLLPLDEPEAFFEPIEELEARAEGQVLRIKAKGLVTLPRGMEEGAFRVQLQAFIESRGYGFTGQLKFKK
jgi:hypothetical protein